MNVAKDYNSATDISYNRQSGMRASAYEHLIPEKLFTDQTQPNAPQAISAVKALAIAASQGQKIFTITQANQDILLPQINVDPDVMTEMQNALSIGKEVTVHQSPITQSGWTGTGYIITDPATGAGAYKISGGANGSYFVGFINGFGLAALLAGSAFGAAPIFMLMLCVLLIASEIATLVALAQSEGNAGCYFQGYSLGVGTFGLVSALLADAGVLGGIGQSQGLVKLAINLLVPMIIGQTISTNTVQSCMFGN
jgi:hypothetical protein